jgi:tetratricopeptide (TPR) repeat protein
MNWTCLIINFGSSRTAHDWRTALRGFEFPMQVEYYTRPESACERMENGGVAAMVVFADENTAALESVLNAFQRQVGCLPDNQAIVSEEPSPLTLAHLFEYGVENIFSVSEWPASVAAFVRRIYQEVTDPSSTERKIVDLTSSLRRHSAEIAKAVSQLQELAQYDFRAAYTQGRAMIASESPNKAVQALKRANQMNHMFKPSTRSFGELLIEFGKFNEAVAVFERLSLQNPDSVFHKASLAVAFLGMGDTARAKLHAERAIRLDPTNTTACEAMAQVHLAEGNVEAAMKVLSGSKNVSDRMVAALNKTGIEFSKKGTIEEALDFFRRAHGLCNPKDAYKITINAAIAALGGNQPELALDYIRRCEREYGGVFPKLDKLRKIAELSLKKPKAA